MLKIKLPGARNSFYVLDTSLNLVVAKELKSMYYPYATLDFIEEDKNSDLLIETDGVYLEIKSPKGGIALTKEQYASASSVYKRICSIIRENIVLDDEYCYLHGSAVLIQNKVFLFLAETGMGKSTLSVFLDMCKGVCLSDDLIILSKKELKVYPIGEKAHIRSSALNLFEGLNCKFQYNKLSTRYDYLLSKKQTVQSCGLILNSIFLLFREKNKAVITKNSTPIESVLTNMFLPYQIKNNVLSATYICQKTKVYNFFYDNFEDIERFDFSNLTFSTKR